MTRRLRKPIRRTISVLTAVLAGISVFQIVPIEAEENSFEATVEEDNGKLEVKASAPSGTLPEDAKLVVTPIKNDGNDSLYADTWNRLNAEAQKENKAIDAFIAYDIQFEKDDKATEPVDGNVNVDLKWDTPVKPDGVQDGDQISVIHLKNDETAEDLSEETDTTKNHATSETDENDPLSLKGVTIQSDSFSVYTVVWSRDLTPAPETTESAAPAATEATPADNTEVQLPTAENDEYSVNVSYNRSEVTNIPEDAYVTVESYADDSAEYNTAREAVIAQKQEDDSDFDASSLGMKAFDISIHSSASPDEIEPNGKVSVSIKLKKLPEEVQEGDSLNIQHIVSQDPAEPAQTETDPSQVKAETVATDVKAEDGAVASFETESFSTYTVQWESDKSNINDQNVVINNLNGRTVAIVCKTGDKYVALSSNKVTSTDENNIAHLQGVEVTLGTDKNGNPTITTNDGKNHDDDIFWRFTYVDNNPSDNTKNFYIESVKKNGVAKDDDNPENKNKFRYLIADIDNKAKKDVSTENLKYGIKEDRQNAKDRDNITKFQVIPGSNNTVRIRWSKRSGRGNPIEKITYQTDADGTKHQTDNYADLNLDGANTNKGFHLYKKENSSNSNFILYDVDQPKKDNTIGTINTLNNNDYDINITMYDYKGKNENNNGNTKGARADATTQAQYFDSLNRQNYFQQGLVKDTLNNQGFPVTANNQDLDNLFSAYSYTDTDGKVTKSTTVYPNVNYLFSKDEFEKTGYYDYNSFKNYAFLTKDNAGNNVFKVYDQIGTPLTAGFGDNVNDYSAYQRGNFFPFNDIKDDDGNYHPSTFLNEIDENDDPLEDSTKDHVLYKTQKATDFFFGMQMDMKFMQPANGTVYNPSTKQYEPMIFDFNGDDDLWVFVDGTLLLDIGGVHGAVHGTIDFKTGEITYYNCDGDETGFTRLDNKKLVTETTENGKKVYKTYIGDLIKEVNTTAFNDNNFNTITSDDKTTHYTSFKNYSTHTLKMFYMERGAGASDLHMRFNLQAIPDNSIYVQKALDDSITDPSLYANREYSFIAYETTDDNANNNNYTPITSSTLSTVGKQAQVQESGQASKTLQVDNNGIFKLKPGQKALIPLSSAAKHYYVREVDTEDQSDFICTKINDAAASWTASSGDESIKGYYQSASNVASDPTPLVFTNKPVEQKLKLIKNDLNGNALGKAKFALSIKADANAGSSQQGLLSAPGLNNNVLANYLKDSDSATGVFSKHINTDNNDDGIITLPVGTYTLTETKAPDGYNKSTHTWTITVTKNDVNIQADDNSTDDFSITRQLLDNNNVYTITIKNTPGTTLPNTGGKGIWIYIFSGSILILFSAYMLYRKHKRKDAYMHLES